MAIKSTGVTPVTTISCRTDEDSARELISGAASDAAARQLFGALFESLNEVDPQLVHLTAKLLETGSPAMRDDLTNETQAFGAALRAALSASSPPLSVTSSSSMNFFRSGIKLRALAIWHAHQLHDEFPSVVSTVQAKDRMMMHHSNFLASIPSISALSENHKYWRGLAILAACDDVIDPSVEPISYRVSLNQIHDFMRWATTHQNLDRVIDIVRKRKVFGITNIQFLIDQQGFTSRSLRAGVL